MELAIVVWVIIAAACILSELISPGLFFFLSAAGGAASAALVSAYDYSPAHQMMVFLGSSIFFCLILYRFVKRSKVRQSQKTNVSALVGKRVVLLGPIRAYEPGVVKIYGDVWQVIEVHGAFVPAQTMVEIVGVKGTHLIVKIVQ